MGFNKEIAKSYFAIYFQVLILITFYIACSTLKNVSFPFLYRVNLLLILNYLLFKKYNFVKTFKQIIIRKNILPFYDVLHFSFKSVNIGKSIKFIL